MRKAIRKLTSALLAVLMITSIFTAMPLTVNSATISDKASVSAPANGWFENPSGSGNWYYYQNSAMVKNDWVFVGSYWYHFGSDGKMQKGWLLLDGVYFYLNPDANHDYSGTGKYPEGAMLKDFKYISNEWYYFYPSTKDGHTQGEMAVGWITDPTDNNEYYFYTNKTQSQNVDYRGNTHPYGAMATSWVQSDVSGRWYYLFEETKDGNQRGAIAKGIQSIKEGGVYKPYLLDFDGGFLLNGWVNHDGAWYYTNNSGELQKSVTLQGVKYEFDNNYKLAKVNGVACTTPVNAMPGDIKTVSNDSIRFQLFDYSKEINYNEDGTVRMPTYKSKNNNNSDQSVFAFKDRESNYPNIFDSHEYRLYELYLPSYGNILEFDDFWLKENHATVQRKLVNNYPVLDFTRTASGSKNPYYDTYSSIFAGYNLSLDYLFGGRADHAVTAYQPVNSILQYDEANKKYSYNSSENAVDYNTETNEFYVRNYKDYIQYDNYPHFFPFNHTDGIANTNSDGSVINGKLAYDHTDYWFGMRMDVDFAQPQGGKINNKDMVFSFSGDDDVWVFIDDVLVLDLGGIHGAVTGTINFRNGQISVNSGTYTATLLKQFQDAGASTADFNGATFKTDSKHTLSMFYMERGACGSGCQIDFNLYIPRTQLDVTRAKNDYKEPYKDGFDFGATGITKAADPNEVCTYQIARKDGKALTSEEKVYRINGGAETSLGADNRFTLKPGDKASFINLVLADEYIISEITQNSDNVKLKESGTYYSNGTTFEAKAEGTAVEVNHFNADPSKITVYFKKPDNWGNNINAYIYGDNNYQNSNWPGQKMTAETGDKAGYYSIQVNASDLNKNLKIIFNDGSNQYPGSGSAGVPITKDSDGKYVVINDTTWYPFLKVTSEDSLVTSAKISGDNTNYLDTAKYIKQSSAGTKVTVNLGTIPDGKRVVGINAVGATVTKDSNGNWSFTMPMNDVTITNVILEDIPQYTVTASSSDSDLGSATADGNASATVEENGIVTLVATPNNSGFDGWELTGDYEITEGSLNSTTLKIRPTSDVDAVASFVPPVYKVKLGNGTEINMIPVQDEPGKYISVSTVSVGADFKVEKILGDTTQYSKIDSGNVYWLTDSNHTDREITWDGNEYVNNNGKQSFENHYKEAYVILDTTVTNNTVSLTESGAPSGYMIYAKDGTASITNATVHGTDDYYTESTHILGKTELSKVTNDSVLDLINTDPDYKLYNSAVGSTIKITTTMHEQYASERYVHAFVINGKKTVMATADVNNTYTGEFVVTEDLGDIIEITPVYYYNACKTPGEYIIFQVMNYEESWGNTLSSYVYYYGESGVDGADTERANGRYPGQPMLYDENTNRYYQYVPKEINGKTVSGLTINNYADDEVHRLISGKPLDNSGRLNQQSYDYDDFVVIANEGYDLAVFDVKYRENLLDNKNYSQAKALNGEDLFVDIDGKPTDVNGNPVTGTNSHKLYIVSNGNIDTRQKAHNIGEWSVNWWVYNENGQLVIEGPCSEFIDGRKTLPAEYVGAETYIVFDGQRSYDNGMTTRLDGRWYYAKLNTPVNAHVRVATEENGVVNLNNTSGGTAIFTDNGLVDITLPNRESSASMIATPASGYIFDGWGYLDENGNFVSLDDNDASKTVPVKTEITYVAVFRQAQAGEFTISHSKYTGPNSLGGNGYYYITAVVTHSDNSTTEYTDLASVQSMLLREDDKSIAITLTTKMSGINSFVYWYAKTDEGFEIIDDPDGNRTNNGEPVYDEDLKGRTGTVTYTFDTEVRKLFSENNKINALYFYSDIAPVTKDVKLIYKYYNRFNESRQYVVKKTLSDDDYDSVNKTWTIPDEMIQNNAPSIDDLYKHCIWVITDSSKDGSVVTLQGKQPEITYTVDFTKYSEDGASEQDSISNISYNSLLVDGENNYLVSTASSYTDGSGAVKKFSYWSVKLTETGEEVVRGYSENFMLRITNDYTLTPVYEGAKNEPFIGAATYTREKFTDSEGGNTEDYVYADFLVSYSSANGILLNKTDASDYQTGVVVETARYAQLSTSEQNAIKEAIASKQQVAVPTQEYGSDTDTIINFIKGGTNKYTYTGDDKITVDRSGNTVTTDSRSLTNYAIENNAKYSNKNVIDKGIRYKTTSAFPTYIMKAYYYVMYKDENGETVVELSDSVYFNLFVTANNNPNYS